MAHDHPMSSPRPLIGLSSAEVHDVVAGRPAIRGVMRTYQDAILAAGAIPVLLAADVRGAEGVMSRIDGFLSCGGPDVDPSLYGQKRHSSVTATDRTTDDAEIALLRAAQRARLPILAICRGMQLLNVSRGGTLHQHVPDLPGALTHQAAPGQTPPTHDVHVRLGSALSAVLGSKALANSFHHQAVDRVGDGLQVIATAADGVVEAIEDPGYPAALWAVQWHPEAGPAGPAFTDLIAAFVAASTPAASVKRKRRYPIGRFYGQVTGPTPDIDLSFRPSTGVPDVVHA
jgi:gamma-glutamyl-gamma-aminobutyrate hydrolase PuuD